MPVLFLCNKLHRRINGGNLKRKHPTIPLHRTPTPAETSDSRSPQDDGPQQDPAAKEVAAAGVHEDVSSACASRSIHARQSHMSSKLSQFLLRKISNWIMGWSVWLPENITHLVRWRMQNLEDLFKCCALDTRSLAGKHWLVIWYPFFTRQLQWKTRLHWMLLLQSV
jgi:hypothetical protein